ncbi:hypothetical protein DXH78_12685 [Undibacter mobilis]|uniref:Uncharacterized protein n=2 Tax=Undibacter mobilis TaxID=2292256 RepID=A0A371BCN9_9BRAD|nr:hypothetical protein DXH78_12685 [Undibacter mobilis]
MCSLIGALLIAPALVGSALIVPARGDDRSLPMHFALRLEGPAAQCGDNCRILIGASGAITADSPRDFIKFMQAGTARGDNLRDATVVLDSDGGSVLGAIALGREIRKARLSTAVGRVVDLTEVAEAVPGDIKRAKVSPIADCESMCAFVVLGGVKRTVPAEARVMVHQIWLGDRREDPTAASYSAEDLVLVQRDIGSLARFTEEMGASIDLLDLALRIPPWEPLHVMSRQEIVAMRLATEDLTTAPVAAAPSAGVRPQRPALTEGAAATPISERGWALLNRDEGAALARRHPLTLKGDRIGSFDLLLSCGADGKFDMSYVERRTGSEAIAIPKQLENVRLRVGRTAATLKVVSSDRKDQASELRSLAMGMVPDELVRGFAEGRRSLVVETTSGGMVTMIRIGNTGAPQNFPRLASACVKPAGDRADASLVQKTGGMASAK